MIETIFYGIVIVFLICLLDTVDPNGKLFRVEDENEDEDENVTECCHVPISEDQRFCPKCGHEARCLLP